jgi:hypothetical protein
MLGLNNSGFEVPILLRDNLRIYLSDRQNHIQMFY